MREWCVLSNKQLLGRIGQIVLVLLGISFITFALVMLSPGDPVRQMIAGNEDIVVSCAMNWDWTSRLSSSISTGSEGRFREILGFHTWLKSLL